MSSKGYSSLLQNCQLEFSDRLIGPTWIFDKLAQLLAGAGDYGSRLNNVKASSQHGTTVGHVEKMPSRCLISVAQVRSYTAFAVVYTSKRSFKIKLATSRLLYIVQRIEIRKLQPKD